MMGALKDLILGHRSTSKYLIPIEDYLQMFNEFKFKEVQNSLNFAQGSSIIGWYNFQKF